ncbi:MAG: epimerase [Gammaproteobacteria bacterium]|nr:epimerase [Gammaproteobacteria bacterium]
MKKFENIAIIGGTGFIGSKLAFKLSKDTNKLVIFTRNKEKNKNLHILPNAEIIEIDINDEVSLKQNLENIDVLINCVGVLNEGYGLNSFKKLHYDLIEKVSRICRLNEIQRFLHISSLNADINGLSEYLKTKGKAENFILKTTSQYTNVTIFRPSVVFGEHDSFFNRFAQILKYSPIFPLACPNTKFSPVYVDDLTDLIISSIYDPEKYNLKIDVTGPKDYTFQEIIELTCSFLGIKRLIIPLNDTFSKLQAYIFDKLPGKLFTIDNYKSLQIDSISENGYKGNSSIEDVVPSYLKKDMSPKYLNKK